MQISIQAQSIQTTTDMIPQMQSAQDQNQSDAAKVSILETSTAKGGEIIKSIAERRGSTEIGAGLILGLANVVATTSANSAQASSSSHTFRIWEDQGVVKTTLPATQQSGSKRNGDSGFTVLGTSTLPFNLRPALPNGGGGGGGGGDRHDFSRFLPLPSPSRASGGGHSSSSSQAQINLGGTGLITPLSDPSPSYEHGVNNQDSALPPSSTWSRHQHEVGDRDKNSLRPHDSKQYVAAAHESSSKIISNSTPTSQPSASGSGSDSGGLNPSCGSAFPFPPIGFSSHRSNRSGPSTSSKAQAPKDTADSSNARDPSRFYCKFPNCSSSFAYDKDLVRHFKAHVEGRAHQCPFCKKSFSRKDALRRHVRSGLSKGNQCAGASTGIGSRSGGRKRAADEAAGNEDGDESGDEDDLESPKDEKSNRVEEMVDPVQTEAKDIQRGDDFNHSDPSTVVPSSMISSYHYPPIASSDFGNVRPPSSTDPTVSNMIENSLSHSSATLNSYVSSSPMDLISSTDTLDSDRGRHSHPLSNYHRNFYCPYPGCLSSFRLPEELGFHAQTHPSRGRHEADLRQRNSEIWGSKISSTLRGPSDGHEHQIRGDRFARERVDNNHNNCSSVPISTSEGSTPVQARFTIRPSSSSSSADRIQDAAFLLPPLKRFKTFSSVSSSSSPTASALPSFNPQTHFERSSSAALHARNVAFASQSVPQHQHPQQQQQREHQHQHQHQQQQQRRENLPSPSSTSAIESLDPRVAAGKVELNAALDDLDSSESHCKGCSKTFSRRDSLLRHWRQVKSCGDMALSSQDARKKGSAGLRRSSAASKEIRVAKCGDDEEDDDDELELDH